jgi:hypothetical protein
MGRATIGLVTVVIGLSVAVSATAQITTGTISGNVTDQANLALPGAAVTITNTETGATRNVTTDAEGVYLVTALPPGLYRVNVTLDGFSSFRQDEFRLAVGQNARVDARLAVGGVAEEVEVVGRALRVDTRSSAVLTVVDPQRMQQLPMLNRSVLSLVELAPGITSVSIPAAVVDQRSAPTIVGAATGARTNQNDIQLDGASLTTSLYNRASNLPSPDSVQEFQVLTNSYSAEFGRGGGVSMMAVTKSGTNVFRGGAWEYHRNDALNGANYFALTKPYMRRNQFGGNLGGPIKRDRTFFFVNYERLRLDTQSVLLYEPPNAAYRAGDFSGLDEPIIDPLTGEPFPGNQIPASRFDPMALRVLDLFVPLPNQPDGSYNENTDRRTDGDQLTIKIDHKLSDANNLNVRWYRDVTSGVAASGDIQATWSRNSNLLDSWTISDTHIFNSRMVGEGRVSFSMIETRQPTSPEAMMSPRDLGAVYDQDGDTPRLPNIFVEGLGGEFGISHNNPWTERSRLNGGNYKISWIAGRHNVKFGFDFLQQSQRLFTQWFASGSFDFEGESTGIGMADFLLGLPSGFEQAAVLNNLERVKTWSGFVQDDIRMNRVTLNVGARIERAEPWKEDRAREATYVRGQQSTRYPQAPAGLVYPGDEGIIPGLVPAVNRFYPRLGFALDVRGDGRTALRGAYGQFGAVEGSISVAIANEVAPYTPVLSFTPHSFRDPYGQDVTSPFPYVLNDSGEGQFPDSPTSLELVSRDWRPGRMHQFNLTLQQQIGNDIVVSAGYVGSRGRDLTTLRPANLAPWSPGASNQNVQQRRPDPNFQAITLTTTGSWSDYDSLQLIATKQYTRGFTLQGTYTLGRTYDDGNVGEAGSTVMNPDDPRADHARASNSRTHVLRVNGMWELPLLEGRPAAVRHLAGGWRLAGIMSLMSGTPVNVTSGVDRLFLGGGGIGAQRPNLNGDPDLPTDRSRDELIEMYFNTNRETMWTLPDFGQFGNAPRNVIIGPGRFNTDLSLTKQFRWSGGSSRRIEVRIEAFNVFDTVNLGNPNGNRNTPTSGASRAPAPRGKCSWRCGSTSDADR